MDWQKQMEQMVSAWTQTQRRVWENWSSAVRNTGLPFPSEAQEQQYRQSLEAWESAVQQALERQREWAGTWSAGELPQGPAEEAAQRWMSQVQEMMKGWTEAQTRLWDMWFENVQRMDPGVLGGDWEKEVRGIMEAWKEASERAGSTLSEWTQAVEGAAGQASGAGASSSTSGGGTGPATGAQRSGSSSSGRKKGS
jgi:hypothetical protein